MGSVAAVSDAGVGPSSPVVVHLIGHPGVGKYTIAGELVRQADRPDARLVLVDNHLTANVVLSVVPGVGEGEEQPAEVWERVHDVRDVLLASIRELSPPSWSFVFTNVALEGHPLSSPSVGLVRDLAAARGSRYVPVRLTCALGEHLRRVTAPERAARQKWRDAAAVGRQVAAYDLVAIDDPALLDLDVTDLSASAAAADILDHLTQVRRPPRHQAPPVP